MSGAIGYYVAWRLAGGEAEPIAERRRRRAALQQQAGEASAHARDWRNSDVTADEADHAQEEDDEFADDLTGASLHFTPDARNRID
jgi:hypothetical protein